MDLVRRQRCLHGEPPHRRRSQGVQEGMPRRGEVPLRGNDCQFHVSYTGFGMDTARQYKERAAKQAARGR